MEISQEQQGVKSNFVEIVGIVFNNWTALKLAIEHGLGGSPQETKNKLLDMVVTVEEFIVKDHAEWHEVSDLLVDLMDDHFATMLEDNSNEGVAAHLCHLYQIVQSGDQAALSDALASLPIRDPISYDFKVPCFSSYPQVASSHSQEKADPPDDGWTVVKKK